MRGVAVDARGQMLLAVGDGEDEGRKNDPQFPVIWRSTDQGTTWHVLTNVSPAIAMGSPRAGFATIRRIRGGLAAVGDAWVGSAYSGLFARWFGDGELDSSCMCIADPHGSVRLNSVADVSGNSLLATGVMNAGTLSAFAAVGYQPGKWRTVHVADAYGAAIMASAATSRGAVIAVGQGNTGGVGEPRIWRTTDGRRLGTVDLGPAFRGGAPLVEVTAVAHGAGRVLAVGASSGRPVVWTSSDGAHFAAPVALTRDAHVTAREIEFGPAGWIVLGADNLGGNVRGVVWTSVDGHSWRQSTKESFGAASNFEYSDVNDATAFGSKWAVVGDRTHDGPPWQSATAYVGDGAGWMPANQRTQQTGTHGVFDLAGDTGSARQMNAVVSGRAQLIAAGWAAENITTSGVPAAWTSRDGIDWNLRLLPVPRGTESGWVDRLVVSGAVIAAVGSVGRSDDQEQLTVWLSHDNGAHWVFRALPGGMSPWARSNALVAVPSGFLAIGSVRIGAGARPSGWRVTTTGHVSQVPLPSTGIPAAAEWTVTGATTDGGRVLTVGMLHRADEVVPISNAIAG